MPNAKILTINNVDYDLKDENGRLGTASEFSTSSNYVIGDYCWYEDKLYRFTANHSSSTWVAAHATEVKITDEIDEFKKVYLDIDFHKGMYVDKTTGSLVIGGTVGGYSDLIKFPKTLYVTKLYYYSYAGGSASAVTFYDEDMEFISSAGNGSQTDELSVDIPNDAVFVRFGKSLDTITPYAYIYTNGEGARVIDEKVLSARPQIFNVGEKTQLTQNINAFSQRLNLTFKNGYFGSDGTIANQTTSNKEKYTNTIKVVPGETLDIVIEFGQWKSCWIATAEYGINCTFIQRSVVINAGGYGARITYTVPANVYYIAFAYRSFDIADINVYTRRTVNTLASLYGKEKYTFDKWDIKAVNHAGFGTFADGYPENTMPVFELSYTHGFDIIETDVRFTSDNVPVLLHDASLNRTARNADGTEITGTVNIAEITYAQSQNYDFGIGAGSEWAGTKIPSFETLVEYCYNKHLCLYCELKESGITHAQVGILFNLIRQYDMERSITWISSSNTALSKVIEIDPGARVGLIIDRAIVSTDQDTLVSLDTGINEVILDVRHNYINRLIQSKSDIDSQIEMIASWGYKLETWDPPQAIQCESLPDYCSGITSDWIDAREVIGSSRFVAKHLVNGSTTNMYSYGPILDKQIAVGDTILTETQLNALLALLN